MIEKVTFKAAQLDYFLESISKAFDIYPHKSRIRDLFEEIYTWGETIENGNEEKYLVKLKPQDWRFFYYLLGLMQVDLDHIPKSTGNETSIFKAETGLRQKLKAQLKDDYIIEKIIEIIKGYDSRIVWKAKDIAELLGIDIEKARVNLKLANIEIAREKEVIKDAEGKIYNVNERDN